MILIFFLIMTLFLFFLDKGRVNQTLMYKTIFRCVNKYEEEVKNTIFSEVVSHTRLARKEVSFSLERIQMLLKIELSGYKGEFFKLFQSLFFKNVVDLYVKKNHHLYCEINDEYQKILNERKNAIYNYKNSNKNLFQYIFRVIISNLVLKKENIHIVNCFSAFLCVPVSMIIFKDTKVYMAYILFYLIFQMIFMSVLSNYVDKKRDVILKNLY